MAVGHLLHVVVLALGVVVSVLAHTQIDVAGVLNDLSVAPSEPESLSSILAPLGRVNLDLAVENQATSTDCVHVL